MLRLLFCNQESEKLKSEDKMDKETINRIKSWLKDFEKTQPGNCSIDEDTFEGEAYYIFKAILAD